MNNKRWKIVEECFCIDLQDLFILKTLSSLRLGHFSLYFEKIDLKAHFLRLNPDLRHHTTYLKIL